MKNNRTPLFVGQRYKYKNIHHADYCSMIVEIIHINFNGTVEAEIIQILHPGFGLNKIGMRYVETNLDQYEYLIGQDKSWTQ
jgi:hypothetical protein